MEALEYYTEQGWVVQAFQWVVAVRGMISPGPLCALLQFLEISKKHWQLAIERTVLVLVRAFNFLHHIRFGCSRGQTYLSWEAANKVTRRYVVTR